MTLILRKPSEQASTISRLLRAYDGAVLVTNYPGNAIAAVALPDDQYSRAIVFEQVERRTA